MKNSNSSIEQKFVYSKIFQELTVPERNKRLKDLQKNVIKLRNSLGLLNIPKSKRKVNRPKTRKSIIMNSIPESMIKDLKKEKRTKRFFIFENYSPQKNNSNNECLTINNEIKEANRLYLDRSPALNALKRKNDILLQKINRRNDLNNDSYKDLYNIHKNDIFMTEFNLPNINAVNKKHNSLRKVHTESNNYYEDTINYLNNNKDNSRNYNYNYKDIYKAEIIRSSSDKNILPPIKLKKEKLLGNNSPKNKNYNQNQISNKYNQLYENSTENNISLSNNSLKEENDIENNKNPDINKQKRNLTIETERRYLPKKKISKTKNRMISIFGKNNQGRKDGPEIKDLVKRNYNISANVKSRQLYYDLEKWIMSSKFKYANWKYGIADINKYFIDMKGFGEQEEKELEMRKSFYEKVELVIKELKEEKEKRDLLNIESKYGIKIDDEEKKIIKDNEYWIDDQACDKLEEMSKVLKMTKERKIKEKEKRNLIEKIMFQCKKGVNNINNS